jgi:glycosyltransferase 2 family protein
MRKLIVALALLMGVVFILTRIAELNKVLAVFQRGNLVYLILALLVQAAWIYNLSAFYQSVYSVLGIEERRSYLVKLVTAANFMTVVTPSGGLSAMAVYISEARRRGRSVVKVTVAAVLYIWFEYIGTLLLSMIGLAELGRRNHLHWAEVAASLILLAGAFIIGLLLYLGMKSPKALGFTLARMARAVNTLLRPFLHRNYLQEERAYSFSMEVSEGILALRSNPRWIFRPFLFTLINKALLLLVLLLSFKAFQVTFDVGTLVAGLSIAHLFLIVSPTPAGIGIVEGILAVALHSLGVSLSDATVVTLSYRGFSFWLPLMVGMVTFRLVQHEPQPLLPPTVMEETDPKRNCTE